MKMLTRHELYDLVWATPVAKLSDEFGISDVAIHKICKKYNVPTPSRGYWAKVAVGAKQKQTPLLKSDIKGLNIITIRPSNARSLPPEVKAAQSQAKAAAKKTEVKLFQAIDFGELNHHVERLKIKLETKEMQKKECTNIQGPKFFSVSIAPTSTERLIKILNLLVKEAEGKGYKIEPGEKALHLNVDGETISIQISEKRDKISYVPTEKERIKLEKWQTEAEQKRKRNEWVSEYDRPKVPEWVHPLNGQLVIEIDKQLYSWDGIRRKFSDGKVKRIEHTIPDILISAATLAAAMKADRIRKEQEKIAEVKRARRAEIERQRQYLEDKRVKSLTDHISRWRSALEIRAFADAAEARMLLEDQEFPEVKKWLAWARSYADKVNPLFNTLPKLEHKKDVDPWEIWESENSSDF